VSTNFVPSIRRGRGSKPNRADVGTVRQRKFRRSLREPSSAMSELHFVHYIPSSSNRARTSARGRVSLDRAARAHVGRQGRSRRLSSRALPYREGTASSLTEIGPESDSSGLDTSPSILEDVAEIQERRLTRRIPSPHVGRVTRPSPAVFGASSVLGQGEVSDSANLVANDRELQTIWHGSSQHTDGPREMKCSTSRLRGVCLRMR
jgi:hypothetical protein